MPAPPPEVVRAARMWVLGIALPGLVGVVTVAMLMGVWRRFHARQQARRRDRPATPPLDAWRISGQRLDVKEDDPEEEDDDASAK